MGESNFRETTGDALRKRLRKKGSQKKTSRWNSITPSNFFLHELIGLWAKVIRSPCPEMIGLSGVIVDETKNTFKLDAGNKIIVVPKRGNLFLLRLPGGEEVLLPGDLVAFRPEERVKKLWRKKRWIARILTALTTEVFE